MVKNLPAIQETWVQFLGQEDSHGEGKSNPLQYSRLKNPMERGAWQATVHGAARVEHDLVTDTSTTSTGRKMPVVLMQESSVDTTCTS